MGSRISTWDRHSLIACLAGVVSIAAASPASSQVVHGPKQYYLALGDSITDGYQAYMHAAGLPPSAFDTGYVDVFAEYLREIQPSITSPAAGIRSFGRWSSPIPSFNC